MDDILEILRRAETLDRPFLAREALKKLGEQFREDLNDVEAVIYTAKALDPVDGLPRYVTTASQLIYKNTDQPVKDALDLIQHIVSNLASASDLSVSKLVDWCIRFLDRDVGNDLKSNIIKIVITVADKCTGLNVGWETVLTKLRNYLTCERKIPPSFRDSLFTVFGKICAFHPGVAENHQEWFFRHLVQALEEYRNGKGISDVLVEASFNGLNGVLVNFSPVSKKVFYDNLKLYASLKTEKRARNTLARSALRVFTAHGSHFSQFIFNDYLEWHQILLTWIDDYKQSAEHKEMGLLALAVFYKIISQNLESNDASEIFFYFWKHFLDKPINKTYVKNLLIGVAALSGNCLRFSNKANLERVLQRFDGDENSALLGIRFEALSQIKSTLGESSSELTTLAVHIIENFPKIEKPFQKYVLDGLEKSFCVWTAHNLENVFYQALLRCCACPIPTDVQVLEDDECVALKDYVPLWKRLLSVNQRTNQQTNAGKIIFKVFVDCFLRIVGKVDLSLDKISQDFLNPAQNFQPRSPNDFLIFVNLVELFELVALTSDLVDSTRRIVDVCLDLSLRNPYVSGFYKIMAGCLVLDDGVDEEGFGVFLSGVVRRIDSVTDDDLLLANLRLILFSPVGVVRQFVPDLTLIFDTAIRTAHGFPELYEWIVNALDHWHGEMDLENVLIHALPKLSSTLLNPAHQRGKIHSMLAQKRFLMFLAKLEPNTRYVEEVGENSTLDGVPQLVYKLSLPDKKAQLVLNRMIPRVVDLAVFSAERGTRVTAAEILHGLVLITLARTRDETNFQELFRMLLRACLTLSCDSDPFFKTLFRELMMQIVHYFAAKRFHQEKTLLEVLFEGVTHPIDAGLRQFGSDCLQEFVAWPEANPQGVDQLLGMICDFTVHPDRTKRIGGVITFNRIFSSADRMVLKKLGPVLLKNFLGCLRECGKDAEAEMVLVAVEHVRELFDGSVDKEIFTTALLECQNENQRVSTTAREFVSNLGVSVCSFVKSQNVQVEFQGHDLLAHISYEHWLISGNVIEKREMDLEEVREILNRFPVESLNEILETVIDYFFLIDEYTQTDLEIFDRIFTKLVPGCQKLYTRLLTHLKGSTHLPRFLEYLPKFNESALVENLENSKFLSVFEIFERSGLVDMNYSGDQILSKIFKLSLNLKPNILVHFKEVVKFAAKRDLTARMVVELITHDEQVDDTTTGEFFFNLFETELSDFLASTTETALIFAKIESGTRWMIAVLNVARDSSTVVDHIFNYWELWTKRSTEQLVDLLKAISKNHSITSRKVIEWFNKLPLTPEPNPAKIIKIFEIFPKLFNELFPLEVLEKNWLRFGRGDAAKTFSPVFEHMLLTCETKWTYKLFKYFFESAALNESIVSVARIEESLKIMSERFSVLDMALVLFDLIFQDFVDRWSIFFLKSALAMLVRNHFDLDFFRTRMHSLLSTLEAPLTEFEYRDLARKCVATELVKIFYEKTAQDDRRAIQEFVGDPELFKKILMACTLRNIECGDKELLRVFYCGCVNVMCTFSKQLNDGRRVDALVLRADMWPYVVSNAEPYKLPVSFIRKKFTDKTIVRKKGYVSSVASTLFESTLREDVRNFDFSHVTIAQASDSSTDLQNDPLNSWEIMKEFCACLKDLHARGFNVEQFLNTSLAQGTFNENCIKLKVIYNCDLRIKPNVVFTAILRILSTGMNFLIQDLLNMMISQGNNSGVNGQLVLDTIELIIEKSSSLRENDLRHIFHTLKNVIEFWKVSLRTCNTEHLLTTRINRTDKLNNFINLELASALLANDLLQMNEKDVKKLVSWLRGVCATDAKHANMSAEVYGLLLSKTKIPQEPWKNDVIILYHVHKFYPEISSNHVDYLFQRAWQERTVLKEYALEMLLSHMKRCNNFNSVEFETAFVPFAGDILKSASQPAQELILQIININCCEKSAEKLLPDVLKLTTDSSTKIRELACEVLIKLYGNNAVKCALMPRINDTCPQIGEKVLQFFSKLCPEGSKNRLNFILSELYAPETESDFLEYAIRILVEPSRMTPDFFLPIFDYPLTDCAFTDLEFSKSFASTFAPMFAPSIVNLDNDLIKKRSSGLVLHRTYRAGDYPDIQIKNSEFIRLLLELVSKDRQFCKILFVTIFSAVSDGYDSEHFANFVQNSPGDDLGCVAGFMEIALDRGVPLPVEGIARLASKTGLLSLGVLLIELSMTETQNTPKRRKSDRDWLHLAELYYDLKDTQAVRGILLNHLDLNPYAKLAISNEISRDFVPAAGYYEQAIKEEIVPDYLNFYNQSYFTSLANLSDWGKILTCVNTSCNDEELWKDSVLLPWKLRSEMLVSSTNFVKYVNGIVQDDGKRTQLLQFSEEASVACWLQSDVPKSISFIHNALTNFLDQWTNSSVWDCTLRKNYLQDLQIIAEIYSIVDVLSAKSQTVALEKFYRSIPNAKSDLIVWDVRLRLRQYFGSVINDENFTNTLTDSFLAFADVAAVQENFTLSRKYLQLTQTRKMDQVQTARWREIRKLCSVVDVKRGTSENKVLDFFRILCDDDSVNLRILTEMIAESERRKCFDWDFLPHDRKNLKHSWRTTFEKVVENMSAGDRGEGYLKFAKILKTSVEFPRIAVAILKSMRYGNQEAREMFALVLSSDSHGLEVLEESRLVPTWMFLMWKNQLAAYLTKNSPVVKEIVERIKSTYPAAFHFQSNVDKIFVDEMYQLVNPFMRMGYFLNQIESALEEKTPDWVMIRAAFTSMRKIVDAPETENNRMIRKAKTAVDSFCKITDAGKLKDAVKILQKDLKKPESKAGRSLKYFSTWLSEFRSLNRLEIPTAVYDGFSEPRDSERVFVAYFKPSVSIIRSIREPVKLTIIGTDAREYSFLVKFGEDLRQDERIQQILSQIRRTCVAKFGGDLVTYRVVPLTCDLGLIQWVDSCKTLRQLMGVDDATVNRVSSEHVQFLASGKDVDKIVDVYRIALQEKSFLDAGNAFQQRVGCFKQDALRSGIYNLTQSPEEFFGFRKNFAQSLGVLSVAHWVIGVGDRHLDNILISKKTGRVVGIDFGMAFGFATQFLPHPELIPFRLTPQMVRVLSPLDENGWLKLSMIEALEAIRVDPAVLLAILQVFVLEPSLDWVQQAKRLARQQGGSVHPQWYQASKIKTVEDKLSGIHPVDCFEVDLKTGRSGDSCLGRFLAVLNGVGSVRGLLRQRRNLSAEEQIRCLIDLAMDPVVLSFTYVGWCPWL